MHDLRETDRTAVGAGGGTANDLRLLDALYAQPLVNARWVEAHLDVTPTTANNMLERLSNAGVLRETTGKKRYRVYRYDRYVALFEPAAAPPEADETIT